MSQFLTAIIDTQKNSYRSIGQVNADDDLELELTIQMNGQPIVFINPECELLIKKSDKNRIRQTKDILYEDGKFKIKVDEQGVTYPGIVTCQLLTKENGRVSTCLFYFMVGASLDREILQSISKIETLEQLDEYIATAFANLDEYEKRIISADETIRKLNFDMDEAEKIRDVSELKRQETFKSLKENMDISISNLDTAINLCNLNEKERSEVFNSLKSDLESIKQDLINLNTSIALDEEKRVQAEINRVNKALEIIEKLETTNSTVTTAEAERVSEFNKIKTENNTLKEALTTINNTANSNEEVRKENEVGRVAAELQRQDNFNSMKLENENFKKGINEQYDNIINKNNTFKEEIVNENNAFKDEMNIDFGNAKTDYFGEEHLNVVDRLTSDFDNVHQRINDSSYLAYEGTNIKADNSYYGLTKELGLKGRTLQNLLGTLRSKSSAWTEDENSFSLNLPTGSGQPVIYYHLAYSLKPNTKYTIIVDILDYTVGSPHFCFMDSKFIVSSTTEFTGKSKGRFSGVLTTKSDVETTMFRILPRNGVDNIYTISKEIIILEGDYTNTPLEDIPFGEGIYSVGESEDNLIKIESCGKNLFDKSKITQYKTIDDNGVIKDALSENMYVMPFIKLQGGKKYVFSVKNVSNSPNQYNNSRVFVYSNGQLKRAYWLSTTPKLTLSEDEDSIAIKYVADGSTASTTIENIKTTQLEEGTVVTDYEPYQESIQELQLTEPLRSLPNGITDEITEDGTEIRRIGKIVLDGSNFDLYSMPTNIENKCRWVIYKNSNVKNISNTHSIATICSDFNSISASDTWMGVTEGIAQNNSGNCLYLFLEKYSSSADYSANKKLLVAELQANPITVYYELAEPIITKHNKNINLKTFDGTTHMTSDNYLQPTISCKVPSNVQAVVMSLKEENEALNDQVSTLNLENENLKTTNDIRDELIDTTMLATDEMYMMIEPLLSEVVQTLSLERSVSKMVDMYVAMVQRGLKTIDEVPARYREQVKEILAQLEK